MSFLLSFSFLYIISFAQPKELSNYNVVWRAQSSSSSESMPCGGGDIGLNVWVENGDVLFYISRSGTFDENNQMLTLGRMRLHFSSDPFAGKDFKQELKLVEGGVTISGNNTEVNLWVDVFRPVVHVSVRSAKSVDVTTSYENWRTSDRVIKGTELRANSYKAPQLFDVVMYKDEVQALNNEILFYHRNRNDKQNVFDYTVDKEGMGSVKDKMFNPLADNTFGGVVKAKGMQFVKTDTGSYCNTSFTSWQLKTKSAVRSQQIEIALNVSQAATIDIWKNELNNIVKDAATNSSTALQKTKAWWQQFWTRSYIVIEGKDSFISRNYNLFRYMLGCNAYGKWPTKFNGGLFVFDPVFVKGNQPYPYSPDFRLWGGGTMTAQNQRLVYYPMIKSGDFDMLKPQFDFYLNALRNAELRSAVYWNHKGACFTEQIENFGLPNIFEYNLKRPADYDAGLEYNAWLEYLWDTVFEFCQMMLETERYESRDIKEYIPFIESCLTFFDEHYQYMAKKLGAKVFNERGEYILYPGSAAETYKGAYNSTTTVCALKVILERMLALPNQYLDTTQRSKWQKMLHRIPSIPLQTIGGKTTLAPALVWARVQNAEAPQLYPVFPWGIYGVGKPGLDTAINTYQLDSQVTKTRSAVGWKQHNIFAARLGLTDEATILTKEKFADGPYRFPAFWGPGYDWSPDHNWGGSAMIGLQEMLMQVDDKKIYLLPAWPKEWNTKFKLHAPYNTIVEGEVKEGKVVNLVVTPASRKADVILCEGEKTRR
ncbi:hypothetical protein KTO63_10905 [Parasegetibacter sp. MAH-26]|uniref:DUF5703 domain-containing protein n=1 Tax=Pinibacter aurantiacus TaxID=2851599 RepID=A0A9E2SAK1_9BACT|nr:hypothetical protein [Pinibacter aurantiacus]